MTISADSMSKKIRHEARLLNVKSVKEVTPMKNEPKWAP